MRWNPSVATRAMDQSRQSDRVMRSSVAFTGSGVLFLGKRGHVTYHSMV